MKTPFPETGRGAATSSRNLKSDWSAITAHLTATKLTPGAASSPDSNFRAGDNTSTGPGRQAKRRSWVDIRPQLSRACRKGVGAVPADQLLKFQASKQLE